MARIVQKHSNDMARMTEELRTLRESYDIQIREYEVLMDLKVQLDQEIATYRALLQEEESRCVWGKSRKGGYLISHLKLNL